MGPVGFDIGCGMVSAKSHVDVGRATHDRKLAFHREVMKRVSLAPGGSSVRFGALSKSDFQEIIRGGAEHYVARYGASFDRSRAERQRIPVSDQWDVPWGGPGNPELGLDQLGSLGGGNHFIELQRCEESQTLFVQLHTGSRGFGHGLATNYFRMAKSEHPERGADIDLGYFEPGSPHYEAYQSAVAAGGNYAIVNREALDRLAIELVFTAHPSEAKRRSIRAKLRRMRFALQALDRIDLLPRERHRLETSLKSELSVLWQTEFLRNSRPTVSDEVERGLSIMPRIWEVVPQVYQAFRQSLKDNYPEHTFRLPLFLQFGSWMGGDRDGNSYVTAAVTAQTLCRHRNASIDHHLSYCRKMYDYLTISLHAAGGGELHEAHSHHVERLGDARIAWAHDADLGEQKCRRVDNRLSRARQRSNRRLSLPWPTPRI